MTDTAHEPVESQTFFAEILQHRIECFIRGADAPGELDESTIEYIEKMIIDGYNQGELCVTVDGSDEEFRGWWSISK